MKTSSIRRVAGFTLVELLVSISIMVLLAGLIVGGFAFVQDRQARETAKLQIALLSRGIDEYRLDMGIYPVMPNANPTTPAQVRQNNNTLFQRLYRDGATDNSATIYVAELNPDNNNQGWITISGGTRYITDPWGREYNYRSGTNEDGSPNPNAMNPDFDLWSNGKDGKTQPGSSGSPYRADHEHNLDDIRNF